MSPKRTLSVLKAVEMNYCTVTGLNLFEATTNVPCSRLYQPTGLLCFIQPYSGGTVGKSGNLTRL